MTKMAYSPMFCKECFAFKSPQQEHACVGFENLDDVGQCNVKLQRMLESIKEYHIFFSQTAAHTPGYGWAVGALAFLQQWITAVLRMTDIPDTKEESSRVNELKNQAEKMIESANCSTQWTVIVEMLTISREVVRDKVTALTEGLSGDQFVMPDDDDVTSMLITKPVIQPCEKIQPPIKMQQFQRPQFTKLKLIGYNIDGPRSARTRTAIPRWTPPGFPSLAFRAQGYPVDALSESLRTDVYLYDPPLASGNCSVPVPRPMGVGVPTFHVPRVSHTGLPTQFRRVFEQPILPHVDGFGSPQCAPRVVSGLRRPERGVPSTRRAGQRGPTYERTVAPTAKENRIPNNKLGIPLVKKILHTLAGEVYDITNGDPRKPSGISSARLKKIEAAQNDEHTKKSHEVTKKPNSSEVNKKLNNDEVTKKLINDEVTKKLNYGEITNKLNYGEVTNKLVDEVTNKLDNDEVTKKLVDEVANNGAPVTILCTEPEMPSIATRCTESIFAAFASNSPIARQCTRPLFSSGLDSPSIASPDPDPQRTLPLDPRQLGSDIDGTCRRRDEAREEMRISINSFQNDLITSAVPMTCQPTNIPRSDSIPPSEPSISLSTPRKGEECVPASPPANQLTHRIYDETDMVTSKWAENYQATVDARLVELQRLTQLSRNESTGSQDILDKTYKKSSRIFAA